MENTITPFAEELQEITDVIRQTVDPEYVLLFGSLTGGTPQSEVIAYDILVVTHEEPRCSWQELKQYLRLSIPPNLRKIANLNLYIYSKQFFQSTNSLFFYLIKSESELLYYREPYLFSKLTKPYNYTAAYPIIFDNFKMNFDLGSQLLDDSRRNLADNNLRLSAFYMSHAAELFYRTLFVVYHNFDTDCTDIRYLHQRLRTLSADLIVLFDDCKSKHGRTLNRLELFRTKILYDAKIDITQNELTDYLSQIDRLKEIVERVCKRRLELCKSRC